MTDDAFGGDYDVSDIGTPEWADVLHSRVQRRGRVRPPPPEGDPDRETRLARYARNAEEYGAASFPGRKYAEPDCSGATNRSVFDVEPQAGESCDELCARHRHFLYREDEAEDQGPPEMISEQEFNELAEKLRRLEVFRQMRRVRRGDPEL